MDGVRNIVWTEYGATVINPLSIAYLLIVIIIQLTIEKKYAAIPILITAGIIPVMQRIVIAEVDFTLVRILFIVAFVRIFLRNEHHSFKLRTIDRAVLAYSIINAIIYILQWNFGSGAIVNRLAHILESFGAYYVFRILIKNREDIEKLFLAISVVSLLIAFFMSIEQQTSHNYFSIFGGVPEITEVREGKLRSQGAFSHPILAGVYGALLIPMMWGCMNKVNKSYERAIYGAGLVSGLIIMVTSSSSTPLIAFAGSLFGIALWPIRKDIPKIRLLILFGMAFLQLFMKSPIWFLMAKIDLVGGSTGYFRAFLFDQFVKRFESWFLLGTRTTMYWGWGLQDVTNQYVLEGVNGGLISLVAFGAIIYLAFQDIRIADQRGIPSISDIRFTKLHYSLGVVLFATSVAFMAVSYFGNMNIYFYLLIACIASLRECHMDEKVTMESMPLIP